MRLIEITNPNIDKQSLTSETLINSFAGDVYSYYKNNITKTSNYSIPAVDLYDFGTLNQHVVAAHTMLNTANSVFGQNSETYKIADFLSSYFSYFES